MYLHCTNICSSLFNICYLLISQANPLLVSCYILLYLNPSSAYNSNCTRTVYTYVLVCSAFLFPMLPLLTSQTNPPWISCHILLYLSPFFCIKFWLFLHCTYVVYHLFSLSISNANSSLDFHVKICFLLRTNIIYFCSARACIQALLEFVSSRFSLLILPVNISTFNFNTFFVQHFPVCLFHFIPCLCKLQ